MRNRYIRFWREDPNNRWAVINANLKFATLNIATATMLVIAKIVIVLT